MEVRIGFNLGIPFWVGLVFEKEEKGNLLIDNDVKCSSLQIRNPFMLMNASTSCWNVLKSMIYGN